MTEHNTETTQTVENIDKRNETPKAPLFVRHLQNAKVRSGVRGGIRNLA